MIKSQVGLENLIGLTQELYKKTLGPKNTYRYAVAVGNALIVGPRTNFGECILGIGDTPSEATELLGKYNLAIDWTTRQIRYLGNGNGNQVHCYSISVLQDFYTNTLQEHLLSQQLMLKDKLAELQTF